MWCSVQSNHYLSIAGWSFLRLGFARQLLQSIVASPHCCKRSTNWNHKKDEKMQTSPFLWSEILFPHRFVKKSDISSPISRLPHNRMCNAPSAICSSCICWKSRQKTCNHTLQSAKKVCTVYTAPKFQMQIAQSHQIIRFHLSLLHSQIAAELFLSIFNNCCNLPSDGTVRGPLRL